jgi:pimeloyl-ACP methyl ester carboxylesterase
VSTPRSLTLPHGVRRITIETIRGEFAALEALPSTGVCERQPALLVPGYTGSKEDFAPILQSLAASGRQVVAIDMRGQFESPGAPSADGYDFAALGADVAVIADWLGAGEGVHLLGHSLGGLVARETLLARAAQVSSLTLMSSGPGALTGPRAVILTAVLGELAGVNQEDLPTEVKRLWDTHLEPQAIADGTPPEIIDFVRTRMLRSCPLGLRTMAQNLLSCPDRTQALAERDDVPMLVIYGEDDNAWAPAVQEEMATRLRAQRVCIPAAAHSPVIEAPETTASTLFSFWNTVECDRARSSVRPGGSR